MNEHRDASNRRESTSTEAGPTTGNGSRSGPEEQRMQGHWILAKLGKRVLRPGGRGLTKRLLEALAPSGDDRIVELGPGLGHTARQLLEVNPASYVGVDPNPQGRAALDTVLDGHEQAQLKVADAADTGLPPACADLVIGEAMLTMQTPEQKRVIAAEVSRILAPGGRYGIHELVVTGDDASAVSRELSRSIKVGAKPLPVEQWRQLLEGQGLMVEWIGHAPMRLLEPSRLVADEGVVGALRFCINLALNAPARRRVTAMRKVFRYNRQHLAAIAVVARKPDSVG